MATSLVKAGVIGSTNELRIETEEIKTVEAPKKKRTRRGGRSRKKSSNPVAEPQVIKPREQASEEHVIHLR
jgi:hypothetical protein